ncbi:MAG: cheW [Acidobacteria bacterium]|nr:cheW [Acidobacteriota bacterium]
MVDLAKIRKKAKGAQAPPAPSETVPSGESADRAPESAVAAVTVAAVPAATSSGAAIEVSPQTSKLERFKQEAGKRRDSLGSITLADSGADTGQQLELLTFIIAGEHFALDIERIVEIVTPRVITRVPNATDGILGIISLRGTIVTLLDVRRKLRHSGAGGHAADRRIIVIDQQGDMTGFEVDRVLRVVKISARELEPHPVVHASELDDAVRGVFRHAGALTILLDLDKLLDDTGGDSAQSHGS